MHAEARLTLLCFVLLGHDGLRLIESEFYGTSYQYTGKVGILDENIRIRQFRAHRDA